MAELKDLMKGDWLRWDSRDWEVTYVDHYRASGDYSETQWELTPHSGPEYYLVMSREDKGGPAEEMWVCTRQTKIRSVQYLTPEGNWETFKGQDSVSEAPARIRYEELEFTLDGETKGTAEDDEGDTVTKITWDYFDAGRRRNIAIEIWKEPDADYFEAYDGRVVSPSDFVRIPAPVGAARHRDQSGNIFVFLLLTGLVTCFGIPIFGSILNVCDAGAEYYIAFMLPAALVFRSALAGAHRGLLAVSLALSAAAAALLLKFRGLGATYWEYALYGVLAGAFLTEAAARLFSDVRRCDKAPAAGNSTLLLLFIISFAHYVKFAPRPHNFSGFFAACALPAFPAALVYFLYLYRESVNEPPQP